ncbi:hypothetical protein VC83_09683 [Pseudogymnoascus destructans]|uniref:DDE-1 domain-containing protein n=1 Tax=Pseudogymnoascus destructans TaxID=655981 RepID=A0A2P6FGQ3_9PEZI|nr:uncharacterized protein VC83_09683 [Pseudogymnoascus destructans]PQM43556.1 hypothetical protein VC83_09683 [Pseudogymnoascus destructans]
MGGEWRWNKKAWMNQYIMAEWLQAFYLHIGSSRSVLLTMDNFPGHTAAIEIAPPPLNIRIIWLPANSTSRFQPLDQGIIASLKAHYRRQWLEFMLVSFENNNDPLDFMSLHLALRWIIRAWYHDVTNTTIYNCFRKSTIVAHPLQLPTEPLPSLNTLYSQVNNAGHIRDAMDLSNFLNPADESLQEGEYNGSNDDILQEVLAQYIQEDTQDEEEEQPEQPVYSMQAAQQALQVLIGYAESEDGVDTAHLCSFEHFERFLTAKRASLQAQGTLDQWIM